MSRIPLQSDGKRPRFFAESGTDETISMLLELMSELWTVKERLYALERAAEEAGLDLTSRIEAWQPSDSQSAELDDSRQQIQVVVDDVRVDWLSCDVDHPGAGLSQQEQQEEKPFLVRL